MAPVLTIQCKVELEAVQTDNQDLDLVLVMVSVAPKLGPLLLHYRAVMLGLVVLVELDGMAAVVDRIKAPLIVQAVVVLDFSVQGVYHLILHILVVAGQLLEEMVVVGLVQALVLMVNLALVKVVLVIQEIMQDQG